MASTPSYRKGFGGMVTRMSRAAMATAAAASQRSWASMYCASSSRSSALSSPAAVARPSARREVLLHRGPGPLQRAVRRGDARVEQVRGVGRRPAEDVPGDERGPLPGRQGLEGGDERRARSSPDARRRRRARRRGRELIQQRVRVGLEPRHFGERAHVHGPPAAGPQQVEADVGGDAVEPRAVLHLAFEALAAAPGAQERLLHGVLGVVERRQHPVAVDVELAAVAARQVGEGPLVARASPRGDREARSRARSSVRGLVLHLLQQPPVAVRVVEGGERAVVTAFRIDTGRLALAARSGRAR